MTDRMDDITTLRKYIEYTGANAEPASEDNFQAALGAFNRLFPADMFVPLEMKLPSLDQLNDMNSAGRVTLLMFRCLCTSDLSFHYSLYQPSTLCDLLDVGEDLVKRCQELDQRDLTPEELKEFAGYRDQLVHDIGIKHADLNILDRDKLVEDAKCLVNRPRMARKRELIDMMRQLIARVEGDINNG